MVCCSVCAVLKVKSESKGMLGDEVEESCVNVYPSDARERERCV